MISEADAIYRFNQYELDGIKESNAGHKLLAGELAGLIIENFLTQGEITAILNGFDSFPTQELIRINEGFISYPLSFAQYTQGLINKTIDEKAYHSFANTFCKEFSTKFGVDVEQKLITVFEQIFVDKKFSVPIDSEGHGSFIPFNFRNLLPGTGELKIHCENLFFNEFPLFFELMSHSVIRKNDFSFFMVLQKPEHGGELCLYDAKWNTGERKRFTQIGDTNNYAQEIEAQHLKNQLVNPNVGSLVVFSGGDIWHKINVVRGTRSRITLGGFVSSGIEENKMFFWA